VGTYVSRKIIRRKGYLRRIWNLSEKLEQYTDANMGMGKLCTRIVCAKHGDFE